MREIKFRAYDKVDKRFIKPYHLCFMHGKTIYDDGHFVCVMGCEGNLFPKDRIILMQYTGLKDKNGKEIYYKDYLRVGEYICKVGWDNEQAKFYLQQISGKEEKRESMSMAQSMEVFGNEFEN